MNLMGGGDSGVPKKGVGEVELRRRAFRSLFTSLHCFA